MAWLESDLISDLTGRPNIKSVSPSPKILEPEDDKGVTWKQVNVFDVSEADGTPPSGQRRNINYYVYHAKQEDESAYYDIGNAFNQDVPTQTKLLAISAADIQNEVDTKYSAITTPGSGLISKEG